MPASSNFNQHFWPSRVHMLQLTLHIFICTLVFASLWLTNKNLNEFERWKVEGCVQIKVYTLQNSSSIKT